MESHKFQIVPKTKSILTFKKPVVFYANKSAYFLSLFFAAILAAITASMLIKVWMLAMSFSWSSSFLSRNSINDFGFRQARWYRSSLMVKF